MAVCSAFHSSNYCQTHVTCTESLGFNDPYLYGSFSRLTTMYSVGLQWNQACTLDAAD